MVCLQKKLDCPFATASCSYSPIISSESRDSPHDKCPTVTPFYKWSLILPSWSNLKRPKTISPVSDTLTRGFATLNSPTPNSVISKLREIGIKHHRMVNEVYFQHSETHFYLPSVFIRLLQQKFRKNWFLDSTGHLFLQIKNSAPMV